MVRFRFGKGRGCGVSCPLEQGGARLGGDRDVVGLLQSMDGERCSAHRGR